MKRAGRSSSRGDDTPSRPLGDVLAFLQLLWAVTHGLESVSKRMRATVGVTGPQRLVIRLVGRNGKSTPGELAEILHVHPSSLTGVFRRLERAQLIRRVADPKDGRRAILTLTPRGQALNDQDLGTVESSVRRTLRGVSPAKVGIVREVLHTLARELEVRAPRSASGRRAGASKPLVRRGVSKRLMNR